MAATKDYLLPDLGEGLTSGEIVSWLVAVGDTVEVDQAVAEVETAKAVVELPSPFAGTITALHAEVGDEVEVGKPLLTIGTGGDGAPSGSDGAGTTHADAEVAEMVPEVEAGAGDDDAVADAGSGSVLVGYGTGGSGRSRRRRGGGASGPASGAPPSGPATTTQARPRAKPPVRKLAKDLGVDLAMVDGTGPSGVVTRDDIRAVAGGRPAEGNGQGAGPPPAAATAGRRIPLRGIRRAIAEKMTVSRREIPEATTWVDVDATPLWNLRRELNAAQDDVKVSPLAIILRACVAGMRRHPEVNASLDAEAGEIVVHDHVNLGFAAQTSRGLVVPVIKGAHQRSTLEIAAELNRLAAAARDGSVTPDEMGGGTFTVSNYGSFRVDGGSAVINHPEAAILGVGQIADRPWVVDGQLAVRKVLQLSIAFDHRICDGGEAAGFLRFVGDAIERPSLLLASL